MASAGWYWVGAVLAAAIAIMIRVEYANRSRRRALVRHRARVDRFKLASRAHVRAQLLDDPAIADAVREHVAETGSTEHDGWKRVHGYIDEIVPFFNVIAYFQIGLRVSRAVLNLFYKVTV